MKYLRKEYIYGTDNYYSCLLYTSRRWQCKSDGKGRGSTPELHLKLHSWSTGEAGGIPSVAVKCVDIRRNTSGEGGLLGFN